VQYAYDICIKELQSRLQSSYESANSRLIARKERTKEHHDKTVNIPLCSVWDKVLLPIESLAHYCGRTLVRAEYGYPKGPPNTNS
jgi:hypothetical protein